MIVGKLKLFAVMLLLSLVIGCSKKNNFKAEMPKTKISAQKVDELKKETKERFELITLLVMDVFHNNPNLLAKFKSSIKKYNFQKGREFLYFKDILENKANLESGFANDFINAIVVRFNNETFKGKERVAHIMGKLKKEIQEKSSLSRTTDDLTLTTQTLLMPHLGSNLYFPFAEDFVNQNTEPFYCYDPLNENATTVEVFKTVNGAVVTQNVTGDDSWAEQNETLVVKLDDNIAGNQLDKYIASNCAQQDFFKPLCSVEQLPDDVIGLDTVIGPPQGTNYCGMMNYNIQPLAAQTTVGDQYLFAATLPKVRLLKNLRWAFWSGGNDIALYRGNARIAQPNRPNFNEAVIDTSFQILGMTINRKKGKKKEWVESNAVFTYNWRLAQRDVYVGLTVVKHWLHFDGAELNFSAAAGVRYDTANGGTWVPSFNANANVNGKINIRVREELEGEQNIPRVSAISQALGNQFGVGSSCGGAVPSPSPGWCDRDYAIRQIDTKFQFFFRMTICY